MRVDIKDLLKKIEETLLFTRRVSDKNFADVPYLDAYDDEDYQTHVGYPATEQKGKKDKSQSPAEAGEDAVEDITGEDIPDETPDEQPTEEAPEEEAPPEEVPPAEATGEIPPDQMAGADPMAMGMGGEVEEPKSPEEIGRVYELKKIYSRLVSVESYLSDSSDSLLLKLRNYVSSSIELFETVISNVDTFKDRIDNVIVMYYEFLDRVYLILKKYYEVKESEGKDGKNKKSKSD